ncbi:MAG: Gfo/Idh/MocA family oxidoreductase [Chitinophagaceae bacterium]|nr:Gfo/Idh/MocA family oxidoreductase [Chitinophagaceae bacterium]
MQNETKPGIARRKFLKDTIKSAAGTAIALHLPTIVPASVFGKNAPSNRINIAAIGTGRISRGHDMPGVWKYDYAQIMAVCDVDLKRANEGKQLVNEYYTKRDNKPFDGVKVYTDFREVLQNKDVDAVLISTPDHTHAMLGVAAARAGKHIYMQKPASLTIAEGRVISNVVQRSGVKFQIGSQQRSAEQFRYGAELVRNGRIGDLKTVYVGLPGDPPGGKKEEMPLPKDFNYDMWLASTPEVYYTEDRVHPQVGYGRPGWLRCEQFGAGMITGWGAHHIDSAHWGMGMEASGPVEIWTENVEFATGGLWDVHGIFKTGAKYANGVTMIVSNEFPNGIKFEGTKGWVFVSRGDYQATSSDPNAGTVQAKKIDAGDPAILTSVIGKNEFHFTVSKDHHGNWLEAIRDNKKTIAPVEEAHRACSACLLHHISMKLKRKLYWDPSKEQFKNDAEANKMLSRPQRKGYEVK